MAEEKIKEMKEILREIEDKIIDFKEHIESMEILLEEKKTKWLCYCDCGFGYHIITECILNERTCTICNKKMHLIKN